MIQRDGGREERYCGEKKKRVEGSELGKKNTIDLDPSYRTCNKRSSMNLSKRILVAFLECQPLPETQMQINTK